MTLEQTYYLAQAIGVIAIAVTLFLITFQLRKNTDAVRISAAQSLLHGYTERLFELSHDPTMTDILTRGLQDVNSLSGTERGRFYAFQMASVMLVQNSFHQWRQGALDYHLWTSTCRIFASGSSSPGMMAWWNDRKYVFTAEFRDYMEQQVFTQKPSPDFRPLGVFVEPPPRKETAQ